MLLLRPMDKVFTAEEARKKLKRNLENDINYIQYIEHILSLINKAISEGKDYIIFQTHSNKTYDKEMIKFMSSKGYALFHDTITKYEYNNEEGEHISLEYDAYRIEF